MDSDATAPGDAADQIFAALARLRGRRGPGDRTPARPGEETDPIGRMPPHPWGEGWRGHGPGPGGPHGRLGGPARFRMLEALAAASAPLSVSELGEVIGVDQPRASKLVQQAVHMGLVQREADPEDARRTRIALTEHGRSLARGFRGQRRETIETALAALTPAERTELVRLLTKFAEAWPR